MKKNDYGVIGFESMLPSDILSALNAHFHVADESSKPEAKQEHLVLDEYELAMLGKI